MQKLYLPGFPWVDLSATPGTVRKTFSSVSRTVRPMVALARFPGPKRFAPAFMPMSSTTGPLTMSRCPEPPVLTVLAWKLNASRSIASKAATMTGKYSGRQPAITALIAAARMVSSSPVAG